MSALLVFKRFGDDLVDRPETPDSFVAASYNALFRADEIGAALSEVSTFAIVAGCIHIFPFHRGGKQQLCFGSEYDGRQSVMVKP